MLSADARVIIDATLTEAHRREIGPVAVTVLDAGGNLVAFQKEDGASLYREAISRGKAHSALGMGVNTRVLAERAKDQPAFLLSVANLAKGGLVPSAGGVLVRDTHGVVAGAVGVSGAQPDDDEACAIAGIEAAGLQC